MKTFYDVLNISEDASIEEIENAYKELKNKYRVYLSDPFNSEKAEEKIKKLDIAFQILSNPERKISYDKDLANMRNNELMSNLQKNTNSHNEELKKQEELANKEKAEKKAEQEKILLEKLEQERRKKIQFVENEVNKQIEEQQRKHEINRQLAAQKKQEEIAKQINEFKKQQKLENKIKKNLEEQKLSEYRSYLRKMGVDVKEPFSIKKFFKTVLATIIVLGIVFLIFQIPFVKNAILENDAIQGFLNIFK